MSLMQVKLFSRMRPAGPAGAGLGSALGVTGPSELDVHVSSRHMYLLHGTPSTSEHHTSDPLSQDPDTRF
jgi:hypothetical protein